MKQPASVRWSKVVLVCLGLFGAAFAITGLVMALPAPAAGGTCGPGRGSEAAIVALFDPITIGAGPEPATTDAAARSQWTAFVKECQTAADDRALAAFPILVVSMGAAVIGAVVVGRRARRRVGSAPLDAGGQWASPPLPPAPPAVAPRIVEELPWGVPGTSYQGPESPYPPSPGASGPGPP